MPRRVTQRQSDADLRRRLRADLHRISDVIVSEVMTLAKDYTSFRKYPSKSPVDNGGSLSIYMIGWRGPKLSKETLEYFRARMLEKYQLHAFVDRLDRVQTDLLTEKQKTHSSLVITIRWSTAYLAKAEEQLIQSSKEGHKPC